MRPDTSASSASSLVSLDPTVVSHITNPRSTISGHARTGSTPIKPHGPQTTGYTRGHGRTVSAPSKQGHKRSNSLRRAKNSTEMLRQRSKKDATVHAKALESMGDHKKGRNFTVTNVGTGGMLYLRPSSYANVMSPTLPAPPSAPLTAPLTAPPTFADLPTKSEAHDKPAPTTPRVRGLSSRTRSVSPKRLLGRLAKSKEAQHEARPPHVRSQSFSTLDDSRKSITSSWPKTLKIIINRFEPSQTPEPDPDVKPSLEIPIPHYRLGVPRFSIHGTPMLRSSVFSRDSSNLSMHRVSGVKHDTYGPGPPPASLKAFAKIQGLEPETGLALDEHQSTSKNVVSWAADRDSRAGSVGFAPSIYDDLNEVYNDSSVVRFAHDIRDVTAATPARIIAQISSESFMDYELVSDFFLTFRSYMTTLDVLDLLLARLAWAIGRMADDGRIIRIRTFAALRHWILNYFLDDFLPNRPLRVRFCDEVNDLYYDVRKKHIGGPSDLKILQDLKRCWNGRCSLYWDGDRFNMDSIQEMELHPGGVIGSRHPEYTDVLDIDDTSSEDSVELPHSAPPPLPSTPTTAQHMPSSLPVPNTAPLYGTRRKPSVASSVHAESRISDQTIQPRSCSILYSSLIRPADGHKRLHKPHPVSVQERRHKAPSDLKVMTSRASSQVKLHKRGGNSFDSTRVRTPHAEEPASPLPQPDFTEGSVIRGFAYAPIEPFVQMPAQIPPSPAVPYGLAHTASHSRENSASHPQANGPTVRNVFGSIRRALSGKHGPGEMAFITISGPVSNTSLLPSKKSQVLLSNTKSSDELRHRATQLPPRSPIRIDLLCAAAVESYQASVPATDLASFPQAPLDMLKDQSASHETHNEVALDAPDLDRIRSHITSQSGSILIVDGTGLGIPAMSGALAYPRSWIGQPPEEGIVEAEPGRVAHDAEFVHQTDGASEQGEERHPVFSIDKLQDGDSVHVSTQGNPLSSAASTTTVKNRQSMASSVAQPKPQASIDETASTLTQAAEETQDEDEGDDEGAKQPPQVLRRRPGGDLRKNQNVHELESPVPHHESLDSLADTVSSAVESLLTMHLTAPMQPYAIHKTGLSAKEAMRHVSMIKTHSSQHLRPSFEAAVAGFSAIPDDDDGGLEATLLKLEGRYAHRSPEMSTHSPSNSFSEELPHVPTPLRPRQDSEALSMSPVIHHDDASRYEEPQGPKGLGILRPESQKINHVTHLVHKIGPAGLANVSASDSQASLPLLQRSSAAPSRANTPKVPPLPQREATTPPRSFSGTERQELPARYSMLGLHSPYSHLRPETAHTNRSFLLDEDEDFSDLSSEMSVDIVNYSEAMGNTGSPILVAPGTAISGLEIPSHPLAHSSFVDLTMQHGTALDANPRSYNQPLTPEPSPIVHRGKPSSTSRGGKNKGPGRTSLSIGPAHVPFILACDSQLLAQQLTLIEQSALTEIEWSDLVEMRWSKQAANVLDWAEFITKPDVKGVDIVITRSNLMVKWALSEIVLTQDIDERVRVITKLIHVAAHARRLHNYATMLQITIALTSTDCTRLVKTWQQVSEPDKSLLKNMETLIQPVRNFNDLRIEMESADLTDGCIPFLGLYVHDLTYNAQKPAEIEAGRHSPPLINFERFRTAAIIVKGLLRLIDASSKYDFEPVHGVIERCLWVASLDDDRIRSLSRTLET